MPTPGIASLFPVLLIGLACVCSCGQSSYDPTRTWSSGMGFYCWSGNGQSDCTRQLEDCRIGETYPRDRGTLTEPCGPVRRAACHRYEDREGFVMTDCSLTLEECERRARPHVPPTYRLVHDCQFVD